MLSGIAIRHSPNNSATIPIPDPVGHSTYRFRRRIVNIINGVSPSITPAGALPDPATASRVTPIYQTSSYVFDSADHTATRAAGAKIAKGAISAAHAGG